MHSSENIITESNIRISVILFPKFIYGLLPDPELSLNYISFDVHGNM